MFSKKHLNDDYTCTQPGFDKGTAELYLKTFHEAFNRYGSSSEQNNNLLKELDDINDCLGKMPNDASLWIKKADMLYASELGKIDLQIVQSATWACYYKAHLLEPKNPDIHLKLGILLLKVLKRNSYGLIAEHFISAIELSQPQEINIRNPAMGNLLEVLRHIGKTSYYLRDIVVFINNNTDTGAFNPAIKEIILPELAQYYSDFSDYSDSLKCYLEYINIIEAKTDKPPYNLGFPFLFYIALCYYKMKSFDHCIDYFRKHFEELEKEHSKHRSFTKGGQLHIEAYFYFLLANYKNKLDDASLRQLIREFTSYFDNNPDSSWSEKNDEVNVLSVNKLEFLKMIPEKLAPVDNSFFMNFIRIFLGFKEPPSTDDSLNKNEFDKLDYLVSIYNKQLDYLFGNKEYILDCKLMGKLTTFITTYYSGGEDYIKLRNGIISACNEMEKLCEGKRIIIAKLIAKGSLCFEIDSIIKEMKRKYDDLREYFYRIKQHIDIAPRMGNQECKKILYNSFLKGLSHEWDKKRFDHAEWVDIVNYHAEKDNFYIVCHFQMRLLRNAIHHSGNMEYIPLDEKFVAFHFICALHDLIISTNKEYDKLISKHEVGHEVGDLKLPHYDILLSFYKTFDYTIDKTMFEQSYEEIARIIEKSKFEDPRIANKQDWWSSLVSSIESRENMAKYFYRLLFHYLYVHKGKNKGFGGPELFRFIEIDESSGEIKTNQNALKSIVVNKENGLDELELQLLRCIFPLAFPEAISGKSKCVT